MRLLLLALAIAPLGAQAQTFKPGRLTPATRDSFDIFYQGQSIGVMVLTSSRTGDDMTMVAAARLPMVGVNQLDSIVFNATSLAPSLVSGKSVTPGGSGSSRITFANGRAKGTATQPSASGTQTITIDTAFAPGQIIDGMEAVLIPTLDFSDGMVVTFQTFDPKTTRTKSTELTVLAKETVTVPAGTIESWKVEMVNDETVTIWVSTADPKKLVMLRLESAMLEMRRAK